MAYDQLQAYFAEAVKDIRRRLGAENIADMSISLSAEGRTLSGDVKLEYSIGDRWGAGIVKGHSLEKCVEEYIRRHGWNERHAPKCLPAIGEPGFED